MMHFIGIDPGRDKCGIAVLNSGGEIKFEEVIPTDELDLTLQKLFANFKVEKIILGDGTTHKSVEKKIAAKKIPCLVVDEKHTTEQARREYWKKNPPAGWRKFLPTSMQVPPEPVDGIVAEILVKRYLAQLSEAKENAP